MAESEIEWWYVGKDGEKTGPACIDGLEGLWLAGELDGLSLVWREGLPKYIPVAESELRDLFQALDGEDEAEEGLELEKSHDQESSVTETGNTAPQWTAKQLWEKQWASANNDAGRAYYANLYTQESSWEPPTQPEVKYFILSQIGLV